MSISETPGVMPGKARPTVSLQRGKYPRAPETATPGTVMARDDRRRHQRVKVPLLGRFMRECGEEYPCQVLNASAGGIAVRAPALADMGERIVLYVDTLGRTEGHVSRLFDDGFAIKLNASLYKREKIANQLTWLVNRDSMSSIEDRRYDRITPRKTSAKLTFSDGTAIDCEILNVSLGGAAIQIEPKPAIGEVVTLGLTQGRVIRHGKSSISIEFAQIQDPATLERQFG